MKSNVLQYMRTCKELGFDIIELSCGFVRLPLPDWQRLVEQCMEMGLTVSGR